MAFLHGPDVVEITEGLTPIRAARTGVIGLVGTAGEGPVNVPTLIAGRRSDGVARFGSSGTIPDALDAIFQQVGAVVVVVNVFDPTSTAAVAEADYQFTGDTLDLPGGNVSAVAVKDAAGAVTYGAASAAVLEADYALTGDTLDLPGGAVSNVVVKSSDGSTTYAEGTDYSVAAATGIITRIGGGGINAGATVKVTYTRGADYSVAAATGIITRTANGRIAANAAVKVAYTGSNIDTVTAAAVAGSDGSADGTPTGVHALLSASSVVGQTPRVLVAPGYSDELAVANGLIAAADRLRGVAVIDGQSTTDAAATTRRGEFDARRGYLVEPGVQVVDAAGETVDRPASGYVAGLIARIDNEEGFWVSPSNKTLAGVVGTSRPIGFQLGDRSSAANLLNENHIATIVRHNGYRLWGSRSLSTDAKWAFISVVRIADALAINLLESHLWAVDRNIGPTYLEEVAAGVNAYIAELVGLGALLSGSCRPSPELNTPTARASGQVYFDVDFTPPAPAERVTFRTRLVQDDVVEALS